MNIRALAEERQHTNIQSHPSGGGSYILVCENFGRMFDPSFRACVFFCLFFCVFFVCVCVCVKWRFTRAH